MKHNGPRVIQMFPEDGSSGTSVGDYSFFFAQGQARSSTFSNTRSVLADIWHTVTGFDTGSSHVSG